MKKFLIADDIIGWQKYNENAVKEIFGKGVIIDCASSATEAYNKVVENINDPYDFILTDMQMEDDYSPKYAGEWFIEQVQLLNKYYKTNIIIISGTYNIKTIAEKYGVDYIPKSIATTSLLAYEELFLR